MDDALTPAPLASVRAAIAHCMLGDPLATPLGDDVRSDALLGAIALHPHQLDAAARLRALIHAQGGALLADDVGLGKTYVALALARAARRPLVVAPASLRDMWRRAMHTADVRADFVSFEALSRSGARPRPRAAASARDDGHDLVVVDEAHHVRNPATRRYRALAERTVGARVLLLSATPIHNRRADLSALLALFLGRRASSLDDDELAGFVVRRDRTVLRDDADGERSGRVPLVADPVVLSLPADDELPDAILDLPPPLPPRDADDGGVLVAHSLVRQWASSDAALRAALRRRLARARALASSLDRGVYPSLSELRAWTSDGESQQIAFAELLAPGGRGTGDVSAFRSTLAAHTAAVRALLATLDRDDSRDDARADLLRELCARHPAARVVAFASFAETVGALFRRLRAVVPACALTASGAVVAGGALTRREALARFAPIASGARQPSAAERIELLLATDLLSEGVSLSDASVVVHLDLPWTPARLEQRVGRAARLGAPHDRVAVYAFTPPASAEATLRIEQRLREKLRVARRVVGVAGAILPGAGALSPPRASAPSASESAEESRRLLERWRGGGVAGGGIVAQLRCGLSGFVAACRISPLATNAVAEDGSEAVLLASLGERESTDDKQLVRRALAAASEGEAAAVAPRALSGALASIDRWAARRAVLGATGIADGAAIRVRRRVIGRIAAIARRLPAHRRVALASLAVGAREAALAPCGAGGEWVLEELARADLPDEAWLRAVRAFGESAVAGRPLASDAVRVRVVALLLLHP